MADIRHRVGINAPQLRVGEMVGTRDGLRGWWTRDVEGEAKVGGRLSFYFGRPEPSAVMEVTELTPDRVAWRCVEGPSEWMDTTVTFDVRSAGDETVVLFTHAGWREPVDFMHHCSTKWGVLLVGLKHGLEGGKATPYPEDPVISSWR